MGLSFIYSEISTWEYIGGKNLKRNSCSVFRLSQVIRLQCGSYVKPVALGCWEDSTQSISVTEAQRRGVICRTALKKDLNRTILLEFS